MPEGSCGAVAESKERRSEWCKPLDSMKVEYVVCSCEYRSTSYSMFLGFLQKTVVSLRRRSRHTVAVGLA